MTEELGKKRLYRLREGAYIGGVCAGLADYFEMDTIVFRILAVLLSILSLGVACIVYLVMWAKLPQRAETVLPYDIRPESAESSAYGYVDWDLEENSSASANIPLLAHLALAVGLTFLFLILALNLSPLIPGTQWWQFWPLGLLMAGLCFIIAPENLNYEAFWHCLGVVLSCIALCVLPMSLGILSWNTLVVALWQFWPFIVLGISLLMAGFKRSSDAFFLAAAFCFIVFCVLGLCFCALPGETQSLIFQSPLSHLFGIGTAD